MRGDRRTNGKVYKRSIGLSEEGGGTQGLLCQHTASSLLGAMLAKLQKSCRPPRPPLDTRNPLLHCSSRSIRRRRKKTYTQSDSSRTKESFSHGPARAEAKLNNGFCRPPFYPHPTSSYFSLQSNLSTALLLCIHKLLSPLVPSNDMSFLYFISCWTIIFISCA